MSVGQIVIIVFTYIWCGLFFTYVYSDQTEIEEKLYGKWRWWEYIISTLGWAIILIIAATISLVTAKLNNESITESMIIYFVVVLNVILGVVQESKADRAIDALKKMSLPYIKVRRGGKILSIKTEDLVIGDIVLIEAGDYVPADIRLISTNSVRVEEAALTRRICSF
jgi:magnesium-transporting ATPase (P-type)